ncbi:MAG TPA: hypothetical protein VH042_05965 [Solirubrobacterales bacterium]|jgi:hypothetical protein|nr:hypothetical protein [Solirubrobacterales bacterium]
MSSLYGFEVKSDLPLLRLNSARGTRGELRIEAAVEPLERPDQAPVSTLISDDGHCWYASYELDDGRCLIELPPSARFLLEPAGGRVVVDSGRVVVDSEASDAALREHRIVSSAVCTLLAMRGDLVLHASAIEADGRAVLFCGPTQRGKSTLARALGEAGHRLLGEDGVAIELGNGEPVAFPGARGVRVRGRDGNGLPRTDLLPDPGSGVPGPCPVAAVVLLGERGERLTVERMQSVRALAMLTPNLVHSGSRIALGAAFANLAGLLSSTLAFAASLPDDLGALRANAELLLDLIDLDL